MYPRLSLNTLSSRVWAPDDPAFTFQCWGHWYAPPCLASLWGCVGFLSGHEEAGKYTVLERVEQGIGLVKWASVTTLTLKLNLVAGSLKYKIRNIGVSTNIGDSQFLSLIFKVLFVSCFKWFSYNAYNDVS